MLKYTILEYEPKHPLKTPFQRFLDQVDQEVLLYEWKYKHCLIPRREVVLIPSHQN